MNGDRQALALPQRGDRLRGAAGLGQEDGRQRVHERQVPAIPGGVQGRGGLRQMVAEDSRVADLLVTEGELVLRETDGAGVVGKLGVFERARMQCDCPRLLAARERDAAVKPP